MTSSHKTYDTEFKLEVARLVAEQGLGVPEVEKTRGRVFPFSIPIYCNYLVAPLRGLI